MLEKNKVTGSQYLGHALGGLGQNIIFGLWSGYMMIFYTDVFGLSAGIVGLLFLVSRLWDGINDPLMGIIADRTRTKWGRFRPWLVFMMVPIGVCLVLNFYVPNISGKALIIYAFVTYILMSMAFTAVDVPYWSLPAAMTEDPNTRTKIFSISRLTTTFASILVGALVIPLVNVIGKGDMANGFRGVAIVFAIVGSVLYLSSFVLVKEHVPASTEKFVFKKAIKALTANKPLVIILFCSLISTTMLTMRMNIQNYYAQYNLGSLDLVPILSVIGLPGIVIGALTAPLLAKKLGKKRVLIVSNIFTLIAGVVFYFVGYSNVTLVIAMMGLLMLPIGINMVLTSAMIADTIEYAEWKTGQRNEGLISSTQTLAAKFSMAIAGGLVGLILVVTNYTPNVQQSVQTLDALHATMSLFLAFGALISLIPLKFYDLTEEKHAEIVDILRERRVNSENIK